MTSPSSRISRDTVACVTSKPVSYTHLCIHKLRSEMQACRGRSSASKLFRIYSLILGLVVQLLLDIGRQRHFPEGDVYKRQVQPCTNRSEGIQYNGIAGCNVCEASDSAIVDDSMQLWINLKRERRRILILKNLRISAKGGTYPLGMRNRSNFAKLKFSEIEGGCIIRIPGFKRYGFF